MIARLSFVIILCFSFQALSQTLTISSATTSSSNWSFSGGVLTVSGTANIQATQIQTWLGSGDLSIVGSTSALIVNVNQAITSTTVGSDLTIGSATNNGAITLNSNLSIAGGLVVRGSDIQINSNITSTATGDLFFQGLSDSWSVRLATGIIIEKTAGTGLLTFQGNGRINNHVNVGSILASGSAQLDVVMIAEMDDGTSGTYNISTGNITTNGGKIWMGAGPKTRVWNGFSVGSTGVPGNTTANGIEITGNISSNGGDILLWSFLGSTASSNGYGDIVAEGANRTINAGSGDIILMTRFNDFVDNASILTVNTTGALILTPASSANFDVTVNFSGTLSTGTFTGSGGLAGLIITNFTSLGELMVGSYNGTGINGDTPFVFSNTADLNLNSAINLAAKVSFYGGDINLNQSINTSSAAALGDVLCKASGDIILAASRSITTSGGDVILWANSDNQNSLGSVALRSSSSIVTGSNSVTGGHVWIGGGSNGGTWNGLAVGAGYAVPGTGFNPPTGGGGWTAGVFFESCSITTFGGDVKILGDAASSGRGLICFGTIAIHTNAGDIEIEGNATNSSLTDVNGILFGLHDISTIGSVSLSSSASGTAITVSGFGRGAENAIGLSGSVTAQSTGSGNIVFNGTSYGTGTAIKVGNFYHGILNTYAASGSVTFNGGTKGLEVAAAQNTSGLTTGPSKLNIGQGGSVASSSSAVIFTGDVLTIGANGIAVNTSGPLTIQPSSNSFTSAITYPSSNFTTANTITGLTIGKDGNTAGVSIGSNQSVAGNINIYAGTLTLNGNLTTTAGGNVSLYSNNALAGLTSQRSITSAGLFSYIPQSNSFGAAVTFPIANLNVSSSGLVLGKTTNASNVTMNASTINGPITVYGGAITVSGAVSAAGNILLDGDTGNFLTQNTRGVHVNAAVSTTNASNGNITIHGRGGSGSGYSGNHGILVSNLIEAGGTGNIQLIGFGGLSSDGISGSSHGVNIDGSNAWVKSNGGNIIITGNGGGAGSGSYSQGVTILTSSKVSAANSGTIAITGTGGVNNVIGLRGLVIINSASVFSAGGAINLTGNNGTNGTDNSDGVTIDASTIGSNSSGPITITGTAGSGTGSEAISLSGTNTIGGISHANAVNLKANNFSLAGATSITTTGAVVIEPTSTSFSTAIQYPITNVTLANTISGLTIGKTGNAANITIGAATSINGPITLYGGTLALNNTLTTTNTTTGNLSLNGTTLSGSSTLTVANGRTLTMNLSSNTNYAGLISGTSLNFVKDGAGTLTLPTPTALSFAAMTISGGAYTLNANQQLTLTGALTNNGTFTMKDGATFVQATSGTSIDGTGTYIVEKALTDNNSTWSTTSGRFWYMGVPMVNVARDSYGTPGTTTNRVWSYSEATKSYTELSNANDLLSAGTGYVHRRSTDGTLTFSATGANGLYGSDYSVSGLTKTAGYTSGVHLVSNPYMGFLDWDAVYNASTNIDPTFYIRSNNTTSNNISALISYNASTNTSTNTSSVTATTSQIRYIAPMQSVWVKVGAAASTGTVNMSRSMLSHQTGNALKSSTVFPTLARVNLVDGDVFDQLLVYMNGDMSNEVDQYDSEKLPVSGTVQVYTMASNKKLVMNGLKNNKKKVSVPLYLELPETKSYTLQLSEYVLEDGLILLEDKQEGTMQDFTLLENYTFYANSGQLHNRFVLHFILPDAEYTTQGPSNSWVGPETSYTDGGNVEITNDDRGNIEITVDQAEEQKVEGNVSVTDMNGKEVYKGQLDGITTAVSLNVPAGIYYLTVQSGTLFEKKKVFIQE
jgi:hypothetical protein